MLGAPYVLDKERYIIYNEQYIETMLDKGGLGDVRDKSVSQLYERASSTIA